MKTAQRPRRSEERRFEFKFVGCGDYHAHPNGVDEDDEHPTVASTFRKGVRGPHHEGT